MKQRITRIFAVLIVAAFLIGTLQNPVFSFSVNPKIQLQHTDGDKTKTSSFDSLSSAVDAATDGDVIMLAGEMSDYTTDVGVEIYKNITFLTGKLFGGNTAKFLRYNGKTSPLFTVKNGATLTIKDAAIYGNTNSENTSGGLVRVEKGGTLVIDGTDDDPVVISECRLTAQDSKGGAIYVEQGGRLLVNGVTFTDNSAAKGGDVYAEQKTDVTFPEKLTVDFAYGESVDISGLNLILSGEIGLVFHTVVPEKYRDGIFVLTSRTRETVTQKISESKKDGSGRYLTEYNLSSVELAEPVTLTVCDGNGDAVAEKTTTAEEYGRILLNEDSASDKEKNVVRTLLNYGHFAQIACAGYNRWEIGKDFAETAKYADLTADKSVFDGYGIKKTGSDPKNAQIGIQLCLGNKTDICLCFPTDEKPAVTVNGAVADVEPYECGKCRYRVRIQGIGALDLAREYEVKVNGKLTLTFSAMSYCKSAVEQNDVNIINAVKALYEFYQATVDYNAKPIP